MTDKKKKRSFWGIKNNDVYQSLEHNYKHFQKQLKLPSIFTTFDVSFFLNIPWKDKIFSLQIFMKLGVLKYLQNFFTPTQLPSCHPSLHAVRFTHMRCHPHKQLSLKRRSLMLFNLITLPLSLSLSNRSGCWTIVSISLYDYYCNEQYFREYFWRLFPSTVW